MKHLKTSIVLLLLCTATAIKAQSFQPKWCIIQKKAVYTILTPSFKDAQEIGGLIVDGNDLAMGVGEVVLSFDKKDGLTYCFDPYGRMVVFKGDSSLRAAPVSSVSSVGLMLEEVELLDGNDVKENSFVWVVGQNLAKSTIKIMVEGGKVLEIPSDKIQLLTKVIRNLSKSDPNYREAE